MPVLGQHTQHGHFLLAATEDNAEQLRELDEAIDSGVTSTSADGHSVSQDLQHLERIRREKRLRDSESISAGRVRPVMVGINLRGAW